MKKLKYIMLQVEQQRGHVASFVEYYMKEYGTSKQEAYVEMWKKITNAWKDINKELLRALLQYQCLSSNEL